MSTFNEFLNHFFKKAKVQASANSVNTSNLRIVKIYSVVHRDVDEKGNQQGIETAKVLSNFVLVEKLGDFYRIIPTKSFAPTENALNESVDLHQLVIKKTKKFNRYRKPVSLCPELANKELSLKDCKEFANKIAEVNSDFNTQDDLKKEEDKLKEICVKFNKILESKAEESLEK